MALKMKPWLGAAVVAGALLALALFKLLGEPGGVPGRLYQYYPAATGFYLEMAPGERLTRRIIAVLNLEDPSPSPAAPEIASPAPQPENAEADQPTDEKPASPAKAGTDPSKPADLPAAPIKETVESSAAALEESAQQALSLRQESRKDLRRRFLQQYNTTFESYFSLGVWPDQAAPDSEGHVLAVLPLKQDMTLADVARRFEIPAEDFAPREFKGEDNAVIPYYVEQNNETALAILDRKLLIANTPQAMQSALAHYTRREPHVYNNPINKTYLARLPRFRQGTFVLNNTVYEGLGPQGGGVLDQVSALGREVNTAVPLTVGAISSRNNRVDIRFLTPLHLKNLPNAAFREHLQAIYEPSQNFPQAGMLPADTGLMLGMAGLDRSYDFYRSHFMPKDMVQMLGVADFYIGSFQLELRKDVVALLETGAVMAARLNRPSFIVMVHKSEAKDKTIAKLSSLLSTEAFPLKVKTAHVGDYALKTVSVNELVPGRLQDEVSYGSVGRTIVFANPQDFVDTLDVHGRKSKSLADTALYKAVMDGMPRQSSALLFINVRDQQQGENGKPTWLEAIGVSLSAEPFQKDEIDLLKGQIQLKLAMPDN